MCHSDESSPPAAPGAVAGGAHGEIVLEAGDGNRFAAYFARAARGAAGPERPSAGVVIMPDIRGLHGFYRELAERFAEIGVDAVAIDYFGRTAGIGDRSESFDFAPHVKATTPEGVAADVAAAAAYLRTPEGGGVASVFTVGFCFGGGYSWRQSADTPGLAGAIGFYGRPALAVDAIDSLRAPLLMLLGGADQHLPAADAEALAAAAEQRGVPAEVIVYPGAPHSFFDRTGDDNREACDDSWARIRAFLDAHTAAAGASAGFTRR
jgi:carboxymethylenebutenolidase